MNKSQKTKKPFALSFLKEIPEAVLNEVVGGNGNPNTITTLAITTTSVGKKDKIKYDEE
jgi:hypothetical protein